ncbi:MAG: amino acid ABC transporter permease [Thermoplasmata archaeon]
MAANVQAWAGRGAGLVHWFRVHRALSAGLFAFAVMAVFFLYLYFLTVNGEFDAEFVFELLPEFLFGMQLTILLTAGSFAVGMILGFATAAARVSRSRVLRSVAKGYVDVFRGTPILVQIFFWVVLMLALIPTYRFFSLVAAFLALTLNTGAYQGEIFRGGMKAIQAGQLEAGRGLGFSRWQLMRHITLPQTLRLIIPPMTNEFILLLKASALVSAIAVVELAFVAQDCAFVSGRAFECWTTGSLLYLAMTVPLAKFVQYSETKFRIPGLGLPVARPVVGQPSVLKTPPAAQESGPALGRRANGLYAILRRRMDAASIRQSRGIGMDPVTPQRRRYRGLVARVLRRPSPRSPRSSRS